MPDARRAGRCGDGYFPYAIASKQLALRVTQLREAAHESGRSDRALPVTIWASSHRADGNSDMRLLREYSQAGASRFIMAAYESPDTSLAGIRSSIRRFRDRLASL